MLGRDSQDNHPPGGCGFIGAAVRLELPTWREVQPVVMTDWLCHAGPPAGPTQD